ncbi:MAG: YkgJ family cysteine cluster protein [Candidatus Bathyarchaeota archaeon]|nr:YkgJ family cysteine cluster protein [Candidatus Bathyarchaeota archaeon]MDH5732227.1 YkgJ family cysteine cluster protein [Candidatus Bathyarchaeota archaeon]
MSDDIAKIVLETKQIADITVCKGNLRFKCKRCAIFCCKLGGPTLAENDVQRIKEAGYVNDNVLETSARNISRHASMTQSRLRKREDGSCVFLKFNERLKAYECSIYDVRPALCRIYPFDFERINSNSLMLKFIPCCRGLNDPDGELIDKKFIAKYLLDAIFEIL